MRRGAREPNPALRLLVTGTALSALGDFVALFALTLRLHDEGGSGFAVSALLLAGTLPLVLLSPWTGLLVDRVENARLVEAVSAAQVVVAVALAFTDGVPATLALMFLLSSGAAVTAPALAALTPVVARGEVLRANGLSQTANSGAALLGPVLGGLLSGLVGSRPALLLNASTFAAVAVTTRLTRARRHPEPSEDGGARPRARDGILVIRRDPLLLTVFATELPVLVLVSGTNVAEVFLVKDALGAGDVAYGVVAACWMAGMVVGAYLLGRRESIGDVRLAVLFLASLLVMGASLAVAGTARWLAVLPVAFLVGGLTNGVQNVAMRTLLHRRVPDALRGRAFAASAGLGNLAILVAYVGGGAAVTTLGPRATVAGGGAAAVVIGLAGLLRARTFGQRTE